MTRLLRAALVPLLLGGMIVIAGRTLGEIYSDPLLFELFAGAAAGSVLLGLLTRPLPGWSAAPLSVLGLGGYLAFCVHLTAENAGITGSLADIAADALANGVPRLLTALVPIEPQPDTVAIPVIAAWLTGLGVTELAGRARRTLLGLGLPTVLYGAALFLVGPHRASVWPSLAFAALAVTALAATGQSSRRRPVNAAPGAEIDVRTRRSLQVRAAVAALAGVAVIVGLTALAGPGLAGGVGRQPVNPRAYVSPPSLDALDQNPLIRLSGWAVNPTEHLLDTTLSADEVIRLAVLTDYDGVTWHVSGSYRPAARTLPSPPAPPPAAADAAVAPGTASTVTQKITVAGLTGKLLPAVATARHVDGVRVDIDTDSGTLMLPDGLRPGLSYDVTSQSSEPDDNTMPMADVPTGPSVSRYLSIGSGTLPQRMQQLAQQLTTDNGTAYARALAIEQFLATHYTLDANAPSGHALPNLDFFLFGALNGNGGGFKGTAEQFAASFAVLARMTGLPSRVVVGFHGRQGTHPVLASDASAWPEVLFAGVGWVPFDPLPHPGQQAEPLEDQYKPKPPPSSEPPEQQALPTESPVAAASGASHAASASAAAGLALPVVAAGSGGLLVLILVGLILIVLIGRSALRRRRFEGPPGAWVNGAWLEVGDALRLAGRPAPEHLSAAEVAEHAREAATAAAGARHVRLPAPPLDDLATMVNAAEFGAAVTAAGDAERARAAAHAYVAELRSRRSWWRRIVWALHPGPLRWNRQRRER
ncbi:transglutaminase family protein [Hamadaea tsunoensis]|uniref:transglutaminase family protein n=1 Tax=Hamadaea tsunoensis TaxID=53368 RepID=UPI000425C5B3|nr:transglutaminase domain-containing protein [Hamadaea tsunoensis]